MKKSIQTIGRRSFLKSSLLSTGGFAISFSLLPELIVKEKSKKELNPIELNGYIKIHSNNSIQIMSPNPEAGQGIKIAMPMIVAEELDVDFNKIEIIQADLDTKHFSRQFIGGSQAIHLSYTILREAGASARTMLRMAAAKEWNLPLKEIETDKGILIHKKTGKKANYGEFAQQAGEIPLPQNLTLKSENDFKIIGHSQKNVDIPKIITGKPLFGIDIQKEGMLYAMIVHPPAFGLGLKSFNMDEIKKMKGIKDCFTIQIMREDYEQTFFDTHQFNEVIALVGNSTWEVMKAKNAIKAQWKELETSTIKRDMFGRKMNQKIPSGLENSKDHISQMEEKMKLPGTILRKDGDFDTAFKNAHKTLERTYYGPYLAHNCMEPMNFYADVRDDKVFLEGPLQKPEYTEQTLSARLNIPIENIEIKMTRLGGGFGRRSYANWLTEAALISQKVKSPVKLLYTREDDMTGGIYRSTYLVRYTATLNEKNELTDIHIKGGGVPESPLWPNRFPAGAVDNYLVEEWTIDTNISVGSYRAPRSNFMAAAEQSFLDELAEFMNEDPINFRLNLLERAKTNPVGKRNEYEAERYQKLIETARDKSNWKNLYPKKKLGFAAYFCHDSYAAHVIDMELKDDSPVIHSVVSVMDCGRVINPDGAINLTEGAIVDGIGAALFGKLEFENGIPQSNNFHNYRMIRMSEAPKKVDVHFMENNLPPSGMGEPAYPPILGAIANALYGATGKRYYNQPFLG